MSLSILIIDDEPNLPHQLARYLRKRHYDVYTAADGEAGLRELQKYTVDLVLLDVRLPKLSGLEVLAHIRELEPELPVVMLTAYGDVQNAVSAMKLGASDYLLKGFDLEELLLVVQRVLETSAMWRELRQLRKERSDNYHFDYLVGHSKEMRDVFDMVAKVARSDTASVLVTGESGTGKEVVAHAIHEQSPRAAGPFHPINCATIPSYLLESELFGHEQYAFTDAKKQKRGLLELAEGGTLFLDEIGEMAPEMQAKLLRVLETRSFFRVGGNKEVTIDVRVLAATNRDLQKAMRDGSFRSDLYFRLAVLRILLPPLRERPDDILLFASRFIEDFNKSMGRNMRSIAPEAQRLMLAYSWPGNVRELKNVIERAMILSNNDELLPSHLPYEIAGSAAIHTTQTLDPLSQWLEAQPSGPFSFQEVTSRVEQHMLRSAMEMTKYSRSQAMKILGLKADQLRYLLNKYGIEHI